MEAYFDNSATTVCLTEVKDIMVKVMVEDYGNPSAMHMKGVEAEKYVNNSKEAIAKCLKVSPKEIIFTSGGTESNNMALIGTADANKRKGRHIITTKIEHPSVSATTKYLEENGYEVTYLPVDKFGVIDPNMLKSTIRDDTIIVSVMYVNNEVGSVMPIDEIGKMIKEINPNTVFHVDAIQAFGKYRIYPKKSKIDLLSVSGHKIHGPKGIGFLYINEKIKVNPIIFGGGQQKGMRSGTENVIGIAGLGLAATKAYEYFEKKIQNMYLIKQKFIELISDIEGIVINGKTGYESAPHIVSVSFEGIKSEVLLHALEDRNIYVSAGSACASNKPAVSETLKSMGIKKELLDSTLRFSFSVNSTMEEVEYCIMNLKELLPVLRKYSKH